MDTEALLFKISSGKALNVGELEEVAALLEWMAEDPQVAAKISMDDIYAMLTVIGRAKNQKHILLIERYLDAKDSLTVSLVLETLCLEWERSDEYLERVIDFALGAAWDKEEDVRQVALKILGEHMFGIVGKNFKGKGGVPELRKRELRVLELLVALFEDANSSAFARQNAYYALCRTYGLDWENIPSEYKLLDLTAGSTDIDWKLLDTLRDVLKHGMTQLDSSELSSSSPPRLKLSPEIR